MCTLLVIQLGKLNLFIHYRCSFQRTSFAMTQISSGWGLILLAACWIDITLSQPTPSFHQTHWCMRTLTSVLLCTPGRWLKLESSATFSRLCVVQGEKRLSDCKHSCEDVDFSSSGYQWTECWTYVPICHPVIDVPGRSYHVFRGMRTEIGLGTLLLDDILYF